MSISALTTHTIRDNAWIRWTILIMISLTMLFAYMFVDVLSPLKTQLDQHLGWDSKVFGIYAGSEFLSTFSSYSLSLLALSLTRWGCASRLSSLAR